MNTSELKYYKIIGRLHTRIASAQSFDDALRGGLKLILEQSLADYAVIWYADHETPQRLHPYYWICPLDLTSRCCGVGEGIVGRVYADGEAEIAYDFDASAEKAAAEDFAGIDIASLICVPFSANGTDLGCIEFIRSTASGRFTEEEADACRLLAIMVQLELEESAPLPDASRERSVLLSVRDLKKSFKNGEEWQQVLKGVNFDVFQGEILCFLGESGCGKSTMLNIIGGLLDADSGTLTFSGQELVGLSQAELTRYRRDHIGFIFQSYNLMPNLNAKQNLDLIGELVDDPLDALEALTLVGMREKASSYPSQLSGGQQQRVSVARALVKKPHLILADEPTAALDWETSIGVLSVLEQVTKSGATLIMVTHNEEITKMADRVIRFRNGRTYEVTINRRPMAAKDLRW